MGNHALKFIAVQLFIKPRILGIVVVKGSDGVGALISVGIGLQRRNGTVSAENRPEGGTVFTVRWPDAGEGGAE